MVDTSRISSGFDVEFQVGSDWLFAAIAQLVAHGVMVVPNGGTIVAVTVSLEPDWNLLISVQIGDVEIGKNAAVAISPDGSRLNFTFEDPDMPPHSIPFAALPGLDGPPRLVVLPGDTLHQRVLAILANLDIEAAAQYLTPGFALERGHVENAQSFLPRGKHIAFGIGRSTYDRIANDVWHTRLRAPGGGHPMPDATNKIGRWTEVRMTAEGGRLKLQLEGVIPLESPLIDIIPDPHLTVTLWVAPCLNAAGRIEFELAIETNVDAGVAGDVFAGIVGAVVSLVLSPITIGFGTLVGAAAGVVVLESAEAVVNGIAGPIVTSTFNTTVNGQPVREILYCKDGVVQVAIPTPEAGGFDLAFLHAIPVSIVTHSDAPDPLHTRTLLLSNKFDDMTVDANGLGVCGLSAPLETFQPVQAQLRNAVYAGGELSELEYVALGGQVQTLQFSEVIARAAQGELVVPFRVRTGPDAATFRIPAGKLATVCLHPQRIHRVDTVIEEIEFENGLRLKVADAIVLQDAGASIVPGYQLIHPRDYNAYYRAKADPSLGNNLEELDTY